MPHAWLKSETSVDDGRTPSKTIVLFFGVLCGIEGLLSRGTQLRASPCLGLNYSIQLPGLFFHEFQSAGTGELAGVGHLGVSGKTVCFHKPTGQKCSNYGYCAIPPRLQSLMDEYQKPFEERDYEHLLTETMPSNRLTGQTNGI